LGYTAIEGYTIRAQETKGKMRPDLVVLKADKPVFVVEVKKLGYDLNKSDFRSGKLQLNEYLQTIGTVRWGMLTNGSEWKLYDFSNQVAGGIEIACFDLKEETEIDLSKKAIEELCYNLLPFHESSYDAESWADMTKEATAFSPESLAKAILNADTLKYIAKSIRGEFEYKANIEVLSDKVFEILVDGLNDAVQGWNETKELELKKYSKAQKRASRKTKKTMKGSSNTPSSTENQL
jgi:hypothetical protein